MGPERYPLGTSSPVQHGSRGTARAQPELGRASSLCSGSAAVERSLRRRRWWPGVGMNAGLADVVEQLGRGGVELVCDGEDEPERRLCSAGLDARDVGVYDFDLAGELGLAEAALFAGTGDVGAKLLGGRHGWAGYPIGIALQVLYF
jgi:hypothetical protein